LVPKVVAKQQFASPTFPLSEQNTALVASVVSPSEISAFRTLQILLCRWRC
jgi:hypothetical protein